MNKRMKEWLRQLARRWKVDLVRKPGALLDRPEAQLAFDVEFAIAHLLLSKPDISIVQVGANDGQTDDPINRLLRRGDCRGILLEPNPEAFSRLEETYRDCPHLHLVNAAIAEVDGAGVLYTLSPNAPGPEWVTGLSSFSKEHLLSHDGFVPNIEKYIVSHEVECLSFDTLFKRYPIGPVDVLQVDTEGFDAEVLRLFDLRRRLPAIVNFEHRHLSEGDWDHAVNSLADLGYKVAIVYQDTLAYRQPVAVGALEEQAPALTLSSGN